MTLIEKSAELNKFVEFKNNFLNRSTQNQELDRYGFAINQKSLIDTDILFTALTHGNEVIGIQILNLLLREFETEPNIGKSIAFLLNNVPAYEKNSRFTESDLNRAFLSAEVQSFEQRRADEIEQVITRLKPKLIIDLHQTTAASLGPFSVIPEEPGLIQLAYKLAPEYPIITFDPIGFSSQGKTLTEYALIHQIPAVVFEIGEKGFHEELARSFKNLLLAELKEADFTQNNVMSSIEYFHISQKIPNHRNHRLKPGFSNLSIISKDQIVSANTEEEFCLAEAESLMIFPRYENILKQEPVIGLLARRKELLSS